MTTATLIHESNQADIETKLHLDADNYTLTQEDCYSESVVNFHADDVQAITDFLNSNDKIVTIDSSHGAIKLHRFFDGSVTFAQASNSPDANEAWLSLDLVTDICTKLID